MNLRRLYEILADCTVQLRKGPVMSTEKGAYGMSVTTIDAMPHADAPGSDNLEKVDLDLLVVGVDKAKAEMHRAELLTILDGYPDRQNLLDGPSYITVGAVLGDQGAAFQLFALGKVLDLWDVITPTLLGIEDPAQARKIAGNGGIMISGYGRAP